MDRQRAIREKFDELYARYRGSGIDDLEYFVGARVAEHFINTEGVSSDEIVDEIGRVIFNKEPTLTVEETKPTVEETKPTVEETKPTVEEVQKERTSCRMKPGGVRILRGVDRADVAKFALGVGVGLALGIVTACACGSKKRVGKRHLNGYLERAKR